VVVPGSRGILPLLFRFRVWRGVGVPPESRGRVADDPPGMAQRRVARDTAEWIDGALRNRERHQFGTLIAIPRNPTAHQAKEEQIRLGNGN
jgi:hypothetical protein